jgi:hypothetical protein
VNENIQMINFIGKHILNYYDVSDEIWVHYIEIQWAERQCQNFNNFASEPRGNFQTYSGVSRRNPKIFVQQKNRWRE